MDKRLIRAATWLERLRDESGDEPAKLEACKNWLALMREVAADPTAVNEAREVAARALQQFQQLAAMDVAVFLGACADLAEDGSDPAVQAEARALLDQAARSLAARGQDISHWLPGNPTTMN